MESAAAEWKSNPLRSEGRVGRTTTARSRHSFSRWFTLKPVVMVLGWLILFQAIACAGAPATRTRPAPSPPECDATICSAALSPDDRVGLGRLAYAVAGDQGEEGLAAVLLTVLNRLASGRFGSDVSAVIEAAGQFEPVNHVGGHWRSLVPLRPGQRATIETMLDLIQQGRLPDPTHGATFFKTRASLLIERARDRFTGIMRLRRNPQISRISIIRRHSR